MCPERQPALTKFPACRCSGLRDCIVTLSVHNNTYVAKKLRRHCGREKNLMGRKSKQPNPDEEKRRTAADLIQVAIRVFMKMHDVERETAQRWIVSAAVAAAENRKPPKSR